MTILLPDFDALWDYSDPAGTERKFRDLLPAVGQPGNDANHAELLTQIARTQGLQRRFDEAHATLDEAEKLLPPDPSRARIRTLLERGRVFNSSQKQGQATPLFLDAVRLAEAAHEDSLAVDALHMLAVADPPQAMEWNLKALAVAERSADPKARQWRGSLYNNIGWTYHDNHRDYTKALELFEKALAFRREQGDLVPILIARWCVARVYRSLGRIGEALAEQRDLEEAYRKLGGGDGYVEEEIAECLLLQGKEAEARPYFAKAYEKLSKDEWFKEAESARLERLKAMGYIGESN